MRCTICLHVPFFSNAREELLLHFEKIYGNIDSLVLTHILQMFDDNCLPLLKAFCKYISIILNTFENDTVVVFKQIKILDYRTRAGRSTKLPNKFVDCVV